MCLKQLNHKTSTQKTKTTVNLKKSAILFIFALASSRAVAQSSSGVKTENFLQELATNGCLCIDSISTYNKSKVDLAKDVSACINKQTSALQMGRKIMNLNDQVKNATEVDGKKELNIEMNFNEDSKEYKKYYYELERYMMANCASLKDKIASNDKINTKSYSDDKKAASWYSKGLDESKKENFKKAAECFEKAVKEDPEFAFAWDNLGLNYRRLNEFDKAIVAYKKSIAIDPKGTMPLQNLAIVYQYKNEFQNAIDTYQQLAAIDNQNPEIYYGIGNIYANNLNDPEKGLENMCKAYTLYVEQKSPYRTDAEKIIGMIYATMKKQGNEAKFDAILKANNISQN